MKTNELGMGMVLHSTSCAPISVEPTTMASLDISNVVNPGICSFCPMDLPKEMVQDEHLATILMEAHKAIDIGNFLADHDRNQPNETIKNEITSNDTMVQNLKKLDVENSSSKRHFVTSAEPKCRKVVDEGRPTLKKTWSNSSFLDIP
ncbi:hypothetical protein Ancab_016243 [Ancistrocladus abbreviatus]